MGRKFQKREYITITNIGEETYESAYQKGLMVGKATAVVSSVERVMKYFQISLESACDALGIHVIDYHLSSRIKVLEILENHEKRKLLEYNDSE